MHYMHTYTGVQLSEIVKIVQVDIDRPGCINDCICQTFEAACLFSKMFPYLSVYLHIYLYIRLYNNWLCLLIYLLVIINLCIGLQVYLSI